MISRKWLFFFTRREQSNNRKRILFSGGTTALTLLMVFSAPHIGREPAPVPDVRHTAAYTQVGRTLPPAEPPTAFVGEKTTNVEPHSIPPTEIDLESPKPSGSPAISTAQEAPRDKPSLTPMPPQNTASITATEPKMGDTRTVGGEKQVYILGFGWIEDSDEAEIHRFITVAIVLLSNAFVAWHSRAKPLPLNHGTPARIWHSANAPQAQRR